MASGDRILSFPAAAGIPPTASFAPLVRRNNHLLAAFDAAADESLDFEAVWPVTFPSSVTLKIIWAADTATSGTTRWGAQFERIGAAQQDLDSDGFATAKTAGTAANGTAGNTVETTITFTSAEADSLAVGEWFRLRIYRDADGTSGTDDMTGDAHLVGLEIYET